MTARDDYPLTACRHERDIVHAAAERWADLAEVLWDELQERHNDDCPAHQHHPIDAYRPEESRGACDCLNVFRVKWAELAGDYTPEVGDDEGGEP